MTLMLVILLAGMSLAVDINISDDQGNLLHSYTLSDTGSIDITVSTGIQPPPARAPSLSITPGSLPDGTEGVSYSASVLMSAGSGTPPYSYSCFGTGLPGITTRNSGTSTCVISGVPEGSGPYSVTFRVYDDAGQSSQTTRSFTVASAAPPPPPPPGAGDPPGVITLTNANVVRYVEILPGESHYYKFSIPQGTRAMMVSMGTNDWRTNQDMMFSLGLPYPTTNDYPVGESFTVNGEMINGSRKWARIVKGGSNESYVISDNVIPGTYYIMVHNTSNIDGKYELYYYAN
jgi:hypothetical protein